MQSSSNNDNAIVVEEVGGSSNVNVHAEPESVLPPMAGGNPNKKTLVLDLDGTLVHTSLEPMPAGYDFILNLEGYDEPFYVLKRPGVDELLLQLGSTGMYEIVIFTAGLKCYADAVVDKILNSLPSSENRNIIPPTHRLASDYCKKVEGIPQEVKDLSILGRDLKKVIFVDDRETSFHLQLKNGILIDSWTGEDMKNKSLFEILSFCLGIEDPKSHFPATEDVRELIQYHFYQSDPSDKGLC